ncbi:MAG: hypothetical protein ACON4K_02945 [Akkermansiaceae bacterium]
MKFGGNLIGVPNIGAAAEDVVIFSITVIQGKAECGTIGYGITTNWWCSEFSSVSSKGGERKERNQGQY